MEATQEFEFTDRYQVLGIPYPDPATICLGPCEGIGCFPVKNQRRTEVSSLAELVEEAGYQKLWDEEHRKSCSVGGVVRNLWRHKEWWFWKSVFRDVLRYLRGGEYCDGWHFVKCSDCDGTGKRVEI